ncbi:MAG: inositol monophosphatase [Bacteroidales bacterium]|nr:inositol monophosphatase [Bacteroidales bacterium]
MTTSAVHYSELTLRVVEIAHQAADFIRQHAGRLQTNDIIHKGLHDLVSYVDKGAEDMIKKELLRLLPGSGFIAEESGSQLAPRFNWIIDPLDGTTNFVHGLPVYSVSIALQEFGITVSGVVLEVNLNECFYAAKDGPAFCNGQQIAVSQTPTLEQSLLATGFPYSDFSRMEPYMKLFDHLMRHSRGLRRLGSAAVDLAYVACGRFDAFYEYALHPWDVAAGAFIVEQAGGKVSTFHGENNAVNGPDILAGNPAIHHQMLQLTSKLF